jgi:hypothetical protein
MVPTDLILAAFDRLERTIAIDRIRELGSLADPGTMRRVAAG